MLLIEFGMHLQAFEQTLADYRQQLTKNKKNLSAEVIGDSHREQTVTRQIDSVLLRVVEETRDRGWMSDADQVAQVASQVEDLQLLTAD